MTVAVGGLLEVRVCGWMGVLPEGGGMVRWWWRFALLALAGVLAAAAGTVLAVAVNVATGGTAQWFPAVERRQSIVVAFRATVAVAGAGLLVWAAQRWPSGMTGAPSAATGGPSVDMHGGWRILVVTNMADDETRAPGV